MQRREAFFIAQQIKFDLTDHHPLVLEQFRVVRNDSQFQFFKERRLSVLLLRGSMAKSVKVSNLYGIDTKCKMVWVNTSSSNDAQEGGEGLKIYPNLTSPHPYRKSTTNGSLALPYSFHYLCASVPYIFSFELLIQLQASCGVA